MSEVQPTSLADAWGDQQPARASRAGAPFNTPLAYLRTFLIVLVVAHHATMAYQQILPPFSPSSLFEYMQSIQAISPVNDEQRSGLLSLFSAFNDTFFMALLFLLSGLFVWKSLQRKGGLGFVRERLIRLGLPLVAMVVLRPLTYYPTYLQNGGDGGFSDFWQQWSAIEWRGGPIWFLEVLLGFNILVVLAARLKSSPSGLLGRIRSDAPLRPVKFFVFLVLSSAVAYVPISVVYGSFFWVQCGPAQIQINRLLLYAVYFLAGVSLGAHGIERTFLVPDSRLANRWGVWSAAALAAFLVYVSTAIGSKDEIVIGLLYVLSGAATSLAFLAIFLRFAHRRRGLFDSCFDNSYGTYVIHYGIVGWLSFAVLEAQLPAVAKWSIVFPCALALSWGATAVLRRIPGVARVI